MSLQNEGRGWVSAARRAFRFTLAAAWLAACGGAVGQTGAGGESHFLRHCVESCGSGLKCVAGVCTRGCEVGTNECDGLAKNATCTDQSVEPGQIAVCDVACDVNASCGSLGADYACKDGFCRAPALPDRDPPTGSGGSAGASSSSGGATSSGGKPVTGGSGGSGGIGTGAPSGCASAVDCPADYECVRDSVRDRGVCVDASRNADCSDGVACPDGWECGEGVRGPTCFPSGVDCNGGWTCPGIPGTCPPGFVHSRILYDNQVDSCFGPCVEASACACGENDTCPRGASCDAETERCTAGVDCNQNWTCPGLPAACPPGLVRSRIVDDNQVDSCFGPCVEATACACAENDVCPVGARCDTETLRCDAPWKAPAICSLPFDSGVCTASVEVFTFQDGSCIGAEYGGCEGNENRFSTLAECLQTCAGVPYPNGCPGGEAPRQTCVQCAPTGGCAKSLDTCPLPCEVAADCLGGGQACVDGFCGDACF